jgi:hypothetical protein
VAAIGATGLLAANPLFVNRQIMLRGDELYDVVEEDGMGRHGLANVRQDLLLGGLALSNLPDRDLAKR